MELECKYFEILSGAVSSNHQNKKIKKNLLKCFTLHVMHLEFIKVSLFEMSYNRKNLLSQNQNELYWPGMFTHTRNLL